MVAPGDHRESFSGDLQAITQHIKATYEEAELEQNATCKSYLQVQQEGARQVSRNILHYSLDLNLAPALQNVRNGFRVHAAADMPPGSLRQSQRYPFWFVKRNAHKQPEPQGRQLSTVLTLVQARADK